jgi:5-formyltetrahydrofolate cyclo-ligase
MRKEIQKKAFRKASLGQLKRIANRLHYKQDKLVLAYLYQEIISHNAQNIMLYIPLELEVDITPLIIRLRKQRRTLYVPFMEGASFRLVKYRLPLHKKRFGVREPNDSKQYKIKKIDIAIVPIVGLDSTHRRVGFGKGMYDRFFEKNIKNINKVAFVARKLCYSQEIITDNYDVKADMIIVP